MSSDVVIVDYNPAWPVMYEEERARIQALIGAYISEIHHVGSTSIPGLGAKPIIDILVIVREFALGEHCVEPLATLGYEYMGEYGIPGRHYFRKPVGPFETRTHHIHMVEKGHDQRALMLIFCEYLRLHPEAAEDYYQLKKELAEKYRTDRENYTDAKAPFVKSIVRTAIEEAFAKRKRTTQQNTSENAQHK